MEKAPGAKVFDLFLFMGQSNMAGRGITSEKWPQKAPVPDTEAGAEFRAVSDPSRLYPVREPFGAQENRTPGINDGSMKTGSMVSAFVMKMQKRPACRCWACPRRRAEAASRSGCRTGKFRWRMQLSLRRRAPPRPMPPRPTSPPEAGDENET